MKKVIAIDPGIAKCGLVIADFNQKKVSQAIVIKSNYLLNFVKKIKQEDEFEKERDELLMRIEMSRAKEPWLKQCWKPAEPTKYASIWLRLVTRCWETNFMVTKDLLEDFQE